MVSFLQLVLVLPYFNLVHRYVIQINLKYLKAYMQETNTCSITDIRIYTTMKKENNNNLCDVTLSSQ